MAASASSSEPEAKADAEAGGLQVSVDKLDKFIEKTYEKDASIAWEQTVHQIGIGGVTVTVTGAIYSILSYVYSYLKTEDIAWFIKELATALGTSVDMLGQWMTPEVIILLLLSTVIARTVQPITLQIAARSSRDQIVNAIRAEQVKRAHDLMNIPGTMAYNATRTLFEEVLRVDDKKYVVSSATDKVKKVVTGVKEAVKGAVCDMKDVVSSATGMAVSSIMTGSAYAREFIVGPPGVVEVRDQIFGLRRAIYIYIEALKVIEVAKREREDEDEDEDGERRRLLDNAHYLLGQTVTAMGKLSLTDEHLEEYIGQGLPGLTGVASEVSVATAGAVISSVRTLSQSLSDAVDKVIKAGKFAFHGDLAICVKDDKSLLTEVAKEVASEIEKYHEKGILPPKKTTDYDPGYGNVVGIGNRDPSQGSPIGDVDSPSLPPTPIGSGDSSRKRGRGDTIGPRTLRSRRGPGGGKRRKTRKK